MYKKSNEIMHEWDCIELDFRLISHCNNPFRDVKFDVCFTGPTGETIKVPSFWDGNNSWKARFSPNVAGEWNGNGMWKKCKISRYRGDRTVG